MEKKEYINAGRPVYFSYARNSNRKPEWEHISDCMDKLLEIFNEKNIEYRLDKRDIGTGNKISAFENEIGWRSEVVVIVFSDKYFRSMHCMYEFAQIKLALEKYPEKRLMCIKSGDFNLADINYIMELEHYWGGLKQEYENIEYHRLRSHSETEKAAWQNGFYMEDVRNLYSFFSSINYSNSKTIDYDSFTNDIIKYYKTTPKPELTPKPDLAPKPEQKVIPEQPQKTESSIVSKSNSGVATQPKMQQGVKQVSDKLPKKLTKLHIGLIIAGFLLVVIGGKCACSDDSDTKEETGNIISNDEDYNAALAKANELHSAQKFSEAIVYYKKIADNLSAEDQLNFAGSYYSLENYTEAREWYQKSAEGGHSGAQWMMGIMYERGLGGEQNFKKAAEWHEKAADQGNAWAQCSLGWLYIRGQGVPQDIYKAKQLFLKAQEQGLPDAEEGLNYIEYNYYESYE